MKIAEGSKSWILLALIIEVIFISATLIINWPLPGVIFLFLTVLATLKLMLLIIFFRDPDRKIGEGIVAPADGKIREISKLSPETSG